jgi:predicted ATPase
MNLENQNGYTFRNLKKINIILGKNGCGKSSALKHVQLAVEAGEQIKSSKYITPERGGALKHDPSLEQNAASSERWLPNRLRNNQFNLFKQQSVLQFRKLEIISLRELEAKPELREDSTYTFQTVIDRINSLLDNIEIKREGADFNIYSKSSGEEVSPEAISSGESELISLGIECLVFAKESVEGQENILFLDEPDAHLHPDLQFKLACFLRKLIEEGSFRVILATHSTSFLAAFSEYSDVAIEFMQSEQVTLDFKEISTAFKRILPIFGAHPLSNIFNESPILLLEGEDDERIWQQAVRTSQGRIQVYPCVAGSVDELGEYEFRVKEIINSIYDSAKAYSLRDRDEEEGDIDDAPPVVRMMLSCRAAENLLLADDCLSSMGVSWADLKIKIDNWLDVNREHAHYSTMVNFQSGSYDRKNFKLKEIRNDLMGILECNKPWEVVVGQAIARMSVSNNALDPDSLQGYLGEKVVSNLLQRVS